MLVGLATQSSKKHTNKCMDGLTHYGIKVTKISACVCVHFEGYSAYSLSFTHYSSSSC